VTRNIFSRPQTVVEVLGVGDITSELRDQKPSCLLVPNFGEEHADAEEVF
jgi:hypothetical protein